ncbi:YALIA101S13e00122g1_1 [Yarrowia lipolytica]|jgi:sorting and assembly machinery component 35|nr:YALIA101S13e00122g1_1 [Yarrowia lipolytica]VBB78649.1 Conserved hypothetical protein [Yarrowia lipolytica]
MLKVPAPIKTFFDAFPLEKLPPLEVSETDSNACQVVGGGSTQSPDFYLYTYGHKNGVGTTLSTEPTSLAVQLLLSHFHPKKSTQLATVSHLANMDGKLPLLVQQPSNRTFLTFNSIYKNLVPSTPQINVLSSLVFHNLYHAWIVTILDPAYSRQFENTFLSVKSLESNTEARFVEPLKIRFMQDLITDHKNLATAMEQSTRLPTRLVMSMESVYDSHPEIEEIYCRAHDALTAFSKLLAESPSQFFNAKDKGFEQSEIGSLDCVVAAFIYSLRPESPFGQTRLGHMVQDFPDLSSHAVSVIEEVYKKN